MGFAFVHNLPGWGLGVTLRRLRVTVGVADGLAVLKKPSVVLQSNKEITLQVCVGWVVWWGAATLCYA